MLSCLAHCAVLLAAGWVVLFGPFAVTATAQTGTQTPLQFNEVPQLTEVYNIGVLDPIADRMRAQGQRAESFGSYLINVAKAKLLEEEVLRSKVRTRIERIQHFYEVRRLRWEEREIARDRVVESKKAMEERRSDFLKNVNLSVQEAAGGKGLNDLLDRICRNDLSVMEVSTDPLPLPPNTTRDLRFELGTGENKSKVLLTDADDPYVFAPPRYFQAGQYRQPLDDYRQARACLLEQVRQGNAISDADLDDALAKYEQLERVFDAEFSRLSFASNIDPNYLRFKQGKDFLEEQIRQIGLLSVAKELPKPFQGTTVQELVRYMSDYGYRFAKADQGGENTYYALYQQMRRLYDKVSN